MRVVNDKRGLESETLVKIAIAVIVLAIIVLGIVLVVYFTKPEVCNNDGVCDSEAGETVENCPGDCGEEVPGESNTIPIPNEEVDDYSDADAPDLNNMDLSGTYQDTPTSEGDSQEDAQNDLLDAPDEEIPEEPIF